MKRFLKYYLFTFISVLMLVHPEATVRYAKASMALCTDVLYPSLFPFFVCSGLLVYSGFCECIAKLFSPIMKPLFCINGSGAAAFVLGIISGYPIGAEVACKLYQSGSISKNECERLLAFCNNSGPLFILGSVGAAMYHSPKIGAMLYFVHILAALSVGIILRFFSKKEEAEAPTKKSAADIPLSEIFTKALQGSVKSIMTVCGCVVFFAVVSNLIADMIPKNSWRTLFLAIAELASGIKTISDSALSEGMKIILSAAAAGFAGLCVHLQVMSVANGKGLSLRLYITGKLMHAGLSALYMYLLLQIFPLTRTVFAGSASLSGAFLAASIFATGTVLILSLLASMGILVLKIKQRKLQGL